MHAIDKRIVLIVLLGALAAAAVAVLATAGHHVAPVVELMHYHGRHIAHVIAMHYHGRMHYHG